MRKAGGSTVRKNALGPLAKEGRATFVEYENFDQALLGQSNLTLAINLRDPVDRLVSQYVAEGGYGYITHFKGKPWRFSLQQYWHLSQLYLHDFQGVKAQTGIDGAHLLYRPNYIMFRLTGNATCGQENLDVAAQILSQFDVIFIAERLGDPAFRKYLSSRLGYEVNTARTQWYGAESREIRAVRERAQSRVVAENRLLLEYVELENACDRMLYRLASRMVERCGAGLGG